MRVIIAGSRTFTDYDFLRIKVIGSLAELQYSWSVPRDEIVILSGNNPKGADALGEKFAEEHNLQVVLFPARWNDLNERPIFLKTNKQGSYNVYAGINRNSRMVNYALKDDLCALIAFDVGSKGIKDTIKKAKKAEMKSFIFNCSNLLQPSFAELTGT